MNAFFSELIRTAIYKRSQGRITRQVTWATIAITLALGLWRLSIELKVAGWAAGLNTYGFNYWLPGLLLAIGFWVAYRAVNLPAFAEFLIAVEAEMNKVSWPTRSELVRASIVVLLTIFFLAAVLAVFDVFWRILFEWLGVLPSSSKEAAAAVVGDFGSSCKALLLGVWKTF